MMMAKELQAKYDGVLKGESAEMEKFTMKLQDYVFDYFNLIVKEYYLSLDKWGQDLEYTKAIKEKYDLIDKQMEEEDLQEEIPEDLTKEVAEQLLSEKEALLKRCMDQVQNIR